MAMACPTSLLQAANSVDTPTAALLHKLMVVVNVLLFTVNYASSQNYGDLRFKQQNITSPSFREGRLEIFIDGQWGTICDDKFGIIDAHVACRQLGYTGAISYGTGFYSPHGRGNEGPIWLDDVECVNRNSIHILSCPNSGVGNHDCDHFSDVTVECINQPLVNSPPNVQGIRLIGDRGYRSSGTLEVFCNGHWGVACLDIFGIQEANAVCRQLGFTGANNFSRQGDAFDTDKPVWFQELNCPIRAYDISYCEGTCGTSDLSAEVSAEPCASTVIECEHTIPYGTLRLVSGSSNEFTLEESAGRLEVFVNNKWGTVCSKRFNQIDADSACNQLGYIRAINYVPSQGTSFGVGIGQISIEGVNCTRIDEFLAYCPRAQIPGTCTHSQDIAVFCTLTPLPPTPPPRTITPDEPFSLQDTIILAVAIGVVTMILCLCLIVVNLFFYVKPYGERKKETQSNSILLQEYELQLDDNGNLDLDQKIPDSNEEGDTLKTSLKNGDQKNSNSSKHVSIQLAPGTAAFYEQQILDFDEKQRDEYTVTTSAKPRKIVIVTPTPRKLELAEEAVKTGDVIRVAVPRSPNPHGLSSTSRLSTSNPVLSAEKPTPKKVRPASVHEPGSYRKPQKFKLLDPKLTAEEGHAEIFEFPSVMSLTQQEDGDKSTSVSEPQPIDAPSTVLPTNQVQKQPQTMTESATLSESQSHVNSSSNLQPIPVPSPVPPRSQRQLSSQSEIGGDSTAGSQLTQSSQDEQPTTTASGVQLVPTLITSAMNGSPASIPRFPIPHPPGYNPMVHLSGSTPVLNVSQQAPPPQQHTRPVSGQFEYSSPVGITVATQNHQLQPTVPPTSKPSTIPKAKTSARHRRNPNPFAAHSVLTEHIEHGNLSKEVMQMSTPTLAPSDLQAQAQQQATLYERNGTHVHSHVSIS